LWKLELIIKERRPRWLGHVLRIEDSRIPRQRYTVGTDHRPQEEAGTDKVKKHRMDIIRRDLKDMGTHYLG